MNIIDLLLTYLRKYPTPDFVIIYEYTYEEVLM